MIPTIGLMIGSYIVARACEMLNVSRILTVTASLIALLLAIVGMADLVTTGNQTAARFQQFLH
jgi:hypothetical protein